MTHIDEPQLETLYDDLRALRHSDPGAVQMGMATNCYAVLSDERGEAVYFDVLVEDLFPLVDKLADEGYDPAALVLTHHHVAVNGKETIERFRERYGVPIFLHPQDATHPQLRDREYEDPVGNELLVEFDLEIEAFPGQTEGSIVAYWHRHGTVMIVGDAAMGATIDEDEEGVERLVRTPVRTNWNDGELRRQWRAFEREVSGIAPYHGAIYIDHDDSMDKFLESLRQEEPTTRN